MTTPTYYGGPKATTNRIRPLNAKGFPEFVTGYLHSPVPMRMTRSAYRALPEEEQKAAKNLAYFCGCGFAEGTTERADRHAESTVLICLDLDTPRDGAPPDYLRNIHDNPELAVAGLDPWNVAIYPTASSTPESPRLRVVVDAAALTPSKQVLRAAVGTIARQLGIPDDFKGLTESTTLSQPMFLPVYFDGEEDRPSVLASRLGGRAFTEADIDQTLHDNTRTYAWRGKVLLPDDPTAGLDQLPVFGLEVEDVREPLFRIDADVERPTWLKVAAALRHQFRDETTAREAYDMFDEWSATGTKYAGEKDTYTCWRSLRPDKQGGPCVTLRSMFKLAMESGWVNSKVAEITKRTFEEWLEATDDPQIVSDQFAKRLLAVPFLNAITEAMLLDKVKRKLSRLSGGNVSLDSVKKQVAVERSRKVAEIRSSDEVPPWLQSWCYVADVGKWLHTRYGADHLISDAAFNILHAVAAGDALPVDTAKKTTAVKRPISMVYDPREEDTFFTRNDAEFFNTYHRGDVPLEEPDDGFVKEHMDKHFLTLTGDSELADTLKFFLAICVQKPGLKIRWMPVLQSGEGAGKTLLSDILAAAVGVRNMKVLNPAVRQTGAWNDWAEGCHLVIIEELVVTGMNKVQTANYYKDFITNNILTISEKYRNARTIPNVANSMAFTNNQVPLFMSESDRRYWFVRSPLQSREQVRELVNQGYFKPLNHIKHHCKAAIRQYFLDIKVPDDFPLDGPAPFTNHGQHLIFLSRNKVSDALREAILASKDPLIASDMVHEDHAKLVLASQLDNNYGLEHYLPERGLEPWRNGERIEFPDTSRTSMWVRRGWDIGLDGDPVAEMWKRIQKHNETNKL